MNRKNKIVFTMNKLSEIFILWGIMIVSIETAFRIVYYSAGYDAGLSVSVYVMPFIMIGLAWTIFSDLLNLDPMSK